jgi:exopolysaccharide production protein ExoQ
MAHSLTMSDALAEGLVLPERQERVRDGLDWSVVSFSAVVSASVLFAYQLISLTVVVSIIAFGLLLVTQPGKVMRSLGDGWLLLIFLGWMLLSAVWSQYPGTTLYYGAEAALTLFIGLQLGRRTRHDDALIGLFLGWSLYTLSSLVFGHSVKWGAHGGSAFSGLSEGKNYAGDTAVLGIIFALHTIRWGLERGRAGMTAFAVLVTVADLAIIAMAQSSGAIMGVAEVFALFTLFCVFMALPITMRSSFLLLGVIFVAILFLARDIWLDPLRGGVLDFFGKDSTLTGRTYLWVRADEIMRSHPWLGVGYNGFWVQGNLDAEGLWRSEGIVGRSGFNFHNSLIEMRVHLGWIGVVMVVSILGVYTARLLKTFTLKPSIATMTWLIILFYEFGRMAFESISLAPFSYATMVLVAAMAAGRSDGVRT